MGDPSHDGAPRQSQHYSTSLLASVLVHGWPQHLDEVTGPATISSADGAMRQSSVSHGTITDESPAVAAGPLSGTLGSVDHDEESDADSVDVAPSELVAALRAAALNLVRGAELRSETGLCISHFAAELDAVAVGGEATVEALRGPAVAPSASAAQQLVNGLAAPLFVWARRRVFLDVLEWAGWRLSDATGHDVTADLGAVAGALSDAVAMERSDPHADQHHPGQHQQQHHHQQRQQQHQQQ